MILSWRRSRKSGRHASKANITGSESEMELTIPTHFRCPISLDLMKDPVTLSTGITYDRDSIEKWIESGKRTCPVTNQPLTNLDQTPNHAIRKMIQCWCVENQAHGIERIPTPRIPVTRSEVSELCSRISVATSRRDHKKCLELVEKAKKWMKESERNRRCVVENDTGAVLAASFEFFASVSMKEHEALLGLILSALPLLFPLSEEGQANLASASSLRCMVWFLERENLSSRQNAVLALKELLSSDTKHVSRLLAFEGVEEALVKIVKEQICPTATKASLTVIYYIISSCTPNEKISAWFFHMDFVSLLLEIIVDAERSLCEKTMAVLEGVCGLEEGREKARDHALTVPVLVKKLLRVSETVTELSISIISKLCKGDDGRVCLVEALKLGGFQKLLVVLQVSCGEKTKAKATELLKMMNQYRGRLECFDSSMDFKYLKRP